MDNMKWKKKIKFLRENWLDSAQIRGLLQDPFAKTDLDLTINYVTLVTFPLYVLYHIKIFDMIYYQFYYFTIKRKVTLSSGNLLPQDILLQDLCIKCYVFKV